MNAARPFEPLNMQTELWLTIPTTKIEISKLVPCQDHLSDTWQPGDSYSGDPFPHVVYYQGTYFISDGHHRIDFVKQQGQKIVEARILYKIDGKILIQMLKTG